MDGAIFKRPIVTDIGSYEDYPFEALENSALDLLQECGLKLKQYEHTEILPRLFRCLECFLQITNQRLTALTFSYPSFGTTYRAFIGALCSAHFSNGSQRWKHQMCRTFVRLMAVLPERLPTLVVRNFTSHMPLVDAETQSYIDLFESIPLNEEKVWLWRGWPSTNRNGQTTFFPLYPVYKRLGRSFTEKLYIVCDNYFTARNSVRLPGLKPMGQFIAQYPRQLTPDDLLQPEFVTRFWRDFFAFYLITGYAGERGARPSSLIRIWRNHFLSFIKGYLVPSGLFAEPWGELPSPDPKLFASAGTNIISTSEGHEVKTKLLTHIPLNISDDEAMHLLFEQIESDLDLFVTWATWAVDDVWRRYQRQLVLSEKGQARFVQKAGCNEGGHKWLTDWNNPECPQNIAATFKVHGFQTNNDCCLNLLYSSSLAQSAHELALPVTDALLPHCVLLVAEHPAITTSFLERLELFDKNGKQTGFIKTDGGYRLVGHKYRRGPNKAQQIIHLTSRTAEVVLQIIALTQPLRDYLKARADDNWRFLFLTCKTGFSYPARANLKTITDPRRLKTLAVSLGNTCKLDLECRLRKTEKFSLSALRASAGVLVYLKTRSVEKMAKALGHSYYNHRLLSRYLPTSILDFFQERWVRIFQTGLIVEALKESECLLEAAEFHTMAELDEFLKNHALRIIPKHLDDPAAPNDSDLACDKNEVIFGINAGILTTLLSLQLAVEQAEQRVGAKANYWAGISRRLITYLESDLIGREDLQDYLAVARRAADPSLMKALIHV